MFNPTPSVYACSQDQTTGLYYLDTAQYIYMTHLFLFIRQRRATTFALYIKANQFVKNIVDHYHDMFVPALQVDIIIIAGVLTC